MGHSHALSGAVIWLAAAPALAGIPALGGPAAGAAPLMWNALTPAELVAGAVICAGAAMLPDLDHPSATLAQTFGPVTWVLSKAVNWLGGGHRGATHSLLFSLGAGYGAHLLAQHSPLGQDIAVVLLIGLALRALGFGIPGRTLTSALVNIGLTAALFVIFHSLGVGYAWLGLAVGIGCLAHVVGDCLTEKGCPVLWPLQHRWLLPYKIGFKTGRKFETKILAPILSAAVFALLVVRIHPAFTAP